MSVVIEQLALRLGVFALRNISFTVNPGETFIILGPSGAGKSVLLETVAGFYRPDAGRIRIGGRDVTEAPPEIRRVGLMFQDYALFPHLTVAQNVQFGCRAAPRRVRELLARLRLEPLAERKPANLSGGEKQRVALARALASDPALFLFDEPLSALDAPTRDALREELKTLLHVLGVSAIYVTHDQAEAVMLADRMAVLREGELQQVGAPAEIFNRPANEFVANFVGVETVVAGHIVEVADGTANVAIGNKVLQAAVQGGSGAAAQVFACIRPEDVALSRSASASASASNQFPARVVALSSLGSLFKVTLDAGFPLVAYVAKQSCLELELAPGASVLASVRPAAVHLIAQ